jgi:predicted AAA+ superfamily ATPase
MIVRSAETALRARLAKNPAVVLLGPRQVGKTTLARKLAEDWPTGTLYLDMERPADRRRLDDADAYLRQQRGKLVIIDEIHRVPGLFEILRGIIDDRRAADERSGHFLLLGSAGIELMRQASESLAGRITVLEIQPLDVTEAATAAVATDVCWLRGGFPDSLLAASDADSLDWRRDFIRSYLERDVPMFAPRLPAETVGRLWTMLAHQQSGLLNQARLASSLGVSAPAVGRYIDLLVDLKLVRRLPPWSGNLGKRLTKAPKVYIRDSGVVHALLELETLHDLAGHPVAGPSFEGMVIENLIAAASERRAAYFFRTQDGAEIDLVFAMGGVPGIAIEIKRASAPTLEKGFTIACEDLGIRQRYVVYPGRERFPIRHGAEAISLPELMELLR